MHFNGNWEEIQHVSTEHETFLRYFFTIGRGAHQKLISASNISSEHETFVIFLHRLIDTPRCFIKAWVVLQDISSKYEIFFVIFLHGREKLQSTRKKLRSFSRYFVLTRDFPCRIFSLLGKTSRCFDRNWEILQDVLSEDEIFFAIFPQSWGNVKMLHHKLGRYSRCFSKRLQSRPLNWYFIRSWDLLCDISSQ